MCQERIPRRRGDCPIAAGIVLHDAVADLSGRLDPHDGAGPQYRIDPVGVRHEVADHCVRHDTEPELLVTVGADADAQLLRKLAEATASFHAHLLFARPVRVSVRVLEKLVGHELSGVVRGRGAVAEVNHQAFATPDAFHRDDDLVADLRESQGLPLRVRAISAFLGGAITVAGTIRSSAE
jgi:hypothetical protein